MTATPLEWSARLVRALGAAAFSHPVGAVRVIETHISWVVLTGEWAYKIKKPVDLGFLDFTTLARREHFCREELRLNGRLAPQLYFDVVPITGTPDAPRVAGAGEPIEFAVRMRQFPQEALLSHRLAQKQLTADEIDQLAGAIAAFHGRIAVAPADSPFGSLDEVRQPVAENFRHIAPPSGDEATTARLSRLRIACEHLFDERRADFARRKAGGFIRECHGDMHLGNMLWLDGRVVLFDGIEFNDHLRWIDVLNDLAFAVMDLADRGRPDFARRLLNAYLEQTGDYAGLAVLPYYLTYRALVRAKVACIRGGQAGVTSRQRQELQDELRGYLELAERCLRPPGAMLLLTHGPSGSGKTHGTQGLIEELGAVRIRSDVERKRLFGLPPLARTAADIGTAIYTPDATARTYNRLADLAESVLAAGFPAVVDATFLKRGQRDRFRGLAERCGVPFVLLDFHTDTATLRRRVAERVRQGHDASEADTAVLEYQLQSREPLGEDEARHAIAIESASAGAEDVLAAVKRMTGEGGLA